MSKFRVKAEYSGKVKYIELERLAQWNLKDFENNIAKSFGVNAVNLKYRLPNGSEQGLYQDFHLENALKQSEEAKDRFFTLAVFPGSVSQQSAAPVVSSPAKPVVNEPKKVTIAPSGGKAFDRLSESLKSEPVSSPQQDAGNKPKFCSNCGAPSTSGKFCAECGTPYPVLNAEPVPNIALSTAASKLADADKRRKRQSAPYPMGGKNMCAACMGHLGVDAVNALDKHWHRECFVCMVCTKSLVTEGFKNKDGKPVCIDCYNEKFGLKCAGCSKSITAAYVNVKGDAWHSDCFVCGKCKLPFSGGYGEKNGQYLCGSCIHY